MAMMVTIGCWGMTATILSMEMMVTICYLVLTVMIISMEEREMTRFVVVMVTILLKVVMAEIVTTQDTVTMS